MLTLLWVLFALMVPALLEVWMDRAVVWQVKVAWGLAWLLLLGWGRCEEVEMGQKMASWVTWMKAKMMRR